MADAVTTADPVRTDTGTRNDRWALRHILFQARAGAVG